MRFMRGPRISVQTQQCEDCRGWFEDIYEPSYIWITVAGAYHRLCEPCLFKRAKVFDFVRHENVYEATS